jgi:hypothetical protein
LQAVAVTVAGDRDGAAFVGGVDDAVVRLGGVLAGGEHADVVDHDQVESADSGHVRAVDPSDWARPMVVVVRDAQVGQPHPA